MSRRQAKKRTWSEHLENRRKRRHSRHWSDYWAIEGGYGWRPVPGRLLASSKLRRRGGAA